MSTTSSTDGGGPRVEEEKEKQKLISWYKNHDISSRKYLLGGEARPEERNRWHFWKSKKTMYGLITLGAVALAAIIGVIAYLNWPSDYCIDHNGRRGTCKNVKNCPAALKDIDKKLVKCQKKSNLIICCADTEEQLEPVETVTESKDDTDIEERNDQVPPSTQQCKPVSNVTRSGRISHRKCLEYQERYVYPCRDSETGPARLDQCNRHLETFVFDGEDAEYGEFPPMALVGYDESEQKYKCGATIISEYFLVTAAHCTSTKEKYNVTHVRIGILNKSEEITEYNRYEVERIYKHPKYRAPSRYHDIALLKTTRPMKFYRYVLPACLHDGSPIDDSRVVALGWGTTQNRNDATPDNLQKVELEKFSEEECSRLCSSYRKSLLSHGYDKYTQVCYGSRSSNRDTCKGDSGGPTLVNHPQVRCMHLITAITGSGRSCGRPGEPGVYTLVAHHLDWIETIVWPKEKKALESNLPNQGV